MFFWTPWQQSTALPLRKPDARRVLAESLPQAGREYDKLKKRDGQRSKRQRRQPKPSPLSQQAHGPAYAEVLYALGKDGNLCVPLSGTSLAT